MNRDETLMVMAVLKASYPSFYKDMKRADAERVVSLWNEMFQDDDYTVVASAVKSFIASDTKGFPPVVGQIREKMTLLTKPKEMTEQEAWSLVSKALKNGIYGYQEEYDKLPEIVQECVGSPTQLKEWAIMDSETVQSVVASNFQRSFKVKSARAKEYGALPSDVKKALSGIIDKFSLEEGK